MTGVSPDTSGSVATYPWEGGEIAPQVRWDQLSPLEQGYVEAMFAGADTALKTDRLSHYAGFSDLAPETLAAIRKDCAAYELQGRTCGLWTGTPQQGRAFWVWRGASRDEAFPPLTPTLSEDGKVRFQ